MYTKEKYLDMIRSNLQHQSQGVIEKFQHLNDLKFAEEVHLLLIDGSLGAGTIHLNLITMEDMFDSIDCDEVEDGFAGQINLTKHFVFNELAEDDLFIDFSIENDLEGLSILEIGNWIKECFDKSKVIIKIPIFFKVRDEENVLNLTTGEWLNEDDVE